MRLDQLIAAHRPGHALARDFYGGETCSRPTSTCCSDRWTCVGHASELAARRRLPGRRTGAESAIVVRGEDGDRAGVGERLPPPRLADLRAVPAATPLCSSAPITPGAIVSTAACAPRARCRTDFDAAAMV